MRGHVEQGMYFGGVYQGFRVVSTGLTYKLDHDMSGERQPTQDEIKEEHERRLRHLATLSQDRTAPTHMRQRAKKFLKHHKQFPHAPEPWDWVPRTPHGHPIESANKQFLEVMLAEIEGKALFVSTVQANIRHPTSFDDNAFHQCKGYDPFAYFWIYCLQKDLMEEPEELWTADFEELLLADPILHLPQANLETALEFGERWKEIDEEEGTNSWLIRSIQLNSVRSMLFDLGFLQPIPVLNNVIRADVPRPRPLFLVDLSSIDPTRPEQVPSPPTVWRVDPRISRYVEQLRAHPEYESHANDHRELAHAVVSALASMLPAQRAAVWLLANSDLDAGILLAMAVVTRRCHPAHFANIAADPLLDYRTRTSNWQRRRNVAGLIDEYLAFWDGSQLRELIKRGEGHLQEFKSTLRHNVNTGAKDDPAIRLACLKSVAAFLNTDGGSLLIGVDDDGTVRGIEDDHYKNIDEFKRAITEMFRNSISTATSLRGTQFVRLELLYDGNKQVVQVICQKSSEPVYVTFNKGVDKKDGAFFIREEARTIELQGPEMVAYIKRRFPGEV